MFRSYAFYCTIFSYLLRPIFLSLRGEEVELEDVLSVLRPFCADACVPVDIRLDALRMLEQCFELDDADTSLLLLYRTQAIVTSQWSEVKVGRDGKGIPCYDNKFLLCRHIWIVLCFKFWHNCRVKMHQITLNAKPCLTLHLLNGKCNCTYFFFRFQRF